MRQLQIDVKVYLEDTDAQGIVYHANYLKYCERARTDILEAEGYTLAQMQQRGFTFVVHEMHLKYKSPARLHDKLQVLTSVERASSLRMTFFHKVLKDGEDTPLFVAEAQVVAIDENGGLRELPDGLLT